MSEYTPGRTPLTAILCLVHMCLVILPATLFADRPDSVRNTPRFYFSYLEFKKEVNGQASQTFELIRPENARDIHVLFQEDGTSNLYSMVPDKGKLTITGSRRRLIRVYAVGRSDGSLLTASASFFLWGDSKAPTEWVPAGQDALKTLAALPFVILSPSREHYWPQTGRPYRFYLSTNTPGNPDFPGPINVLEREAIRPLPADGTHIPSHDALLNRQGSGAFRQDIIFADLVHDGKNLQASYTLKLHRSRTAQDAPLFGWMTLGGSLIFFVGWIIIKRRRPWWSA